MFATGLDKRRHDPQTLRLRAYEPSLTVNDLQKSIDFYTKILGFFQGERWEEGGVLKGISLKAGACQLGLSQDDWSKGRDRVKGVGVRIWCETVQDINALADRIKRAGGVLAEEPTDNPEFKMQSLAIDDPDGYHITIYRKTS
jgi:catechol 2,3-dioxygenase-like lactoylglutathione lyase family enzyme